MKEILFYIPLFGTVIGLFLVAFIMLSKSVHYNVKSARYYLALAIFITTLNLFEGVRNNGHDQLAWLFYFFYQFLGISYLLYANSLLDLNLKLKKWKLTVGIYSLIHSGILIYFKERFLRLSTADFEFISSADLLIALDYYIVFFLNIYAVLYVFKRVRKISNDNLSPKDQINLMWIKKVFGGVSIFYFGTLFFILVMSVFEVLYNKTGLGLTPEGVSGSVYKFFLNAYIYEKFEVILTSFFIFTIAVWSVRIPVFASYLPLAEESREVKKYAKSTLKDDQSEQIWEQVIKLMQEDKLYRNPTLRLSDIVDKIGKPLPHVSQVINEKMNMNFLDLVNQYRVEDAKDLLINPKTKSMTILAIAYEVGFNSKTTFYTSFKKVTGQTPSEFKKENSN